MKNEKIYKAKYIQGEKYIEIKDINWNYSEDMVEAKIVEGNFKGQMVVVSKCYIREYDSMEETMIDFLNKEGYTWESMGVETWYTVHGTDYEVNIYVDIEEGSFYVESLNLNIDYDSIHKNDVYWDDTDKYKNKKDVKTLKGLKSYLEKFAY